MRILFVSHTYKPAYVGGGGPIYSIAALAEGLTRKGHEVCIFTVNGNNIDGILNVPVNKPVDVDGVEVWYFTRVDVRKRLLLPISYMTKSFGYLYSPEMSRELDRRMPKVDLVHTHIPFVYPTLAASKSARRFNKPHFYHQRGVLQPDHLKFRGLKKRLYIKVIERPIMRRATTLIALTQAEVDAYRALRVHTPCRVIPNGIDIMDHPQSFEQSARSFHDILPDEMVILFMARLHPIKGADRLIRAFLMIHRAFPKSKLIIAGPDEWGMVEKFRQEIMKAGLGNRVMFPGMVTGEDKQELLARADLFCLPSDAEGFSIAVLEAMASKTAVLISPGCHFPEVEKVGAGRVVPSEPEALSKAIAALLDNPERLKDMGRKGRDLVLRHYSWDTITDQFIDTYTEGIERHKAFRGR